METRISIKDSNKSNLNSRLTPVIIVNAFILTTFISISNPGLCEFYQLSELAFPRVADAGDQISFIVNESDPREYLYVAGLEPGQSTKYWLQDNESAEPWEVSAIADIRSVEPGRWNLTFENDGRIAIVYYLPEMCGWTASSTNPDRFICPSLRINRTTAFSLLTYSLDHACTLRIQGDVDSYFYDRFLRPRGRYSEMTYEKEMVDVVVIAPRGVEEIIDFSITTAVTGFPDVATAVVLVVSCTIAALAVIIIWKKRRGMENNHGKGRQSPNSRMMKPR